MDKLVVRWKKLLFLCGLLTETAGIYREYTTEEVKVRKGIFPGLPNNNRHRYINSSTTMW